MSNREQERRGIDVAIAGRKRAEAALEESAEAFRMLAESLPQLVWICSPDGAHIYFNQRWVKYTGLTLEESYGSGWNRPFHPEDLQIISSLLSLQAGDLPENAQRAFEESQRRVQSMALIHDQLYRTDHPDRLDFGGYAATLTDSLFAAHNTCSGCVRLCRELDPVLLSLDQAMPCGLILSEMVTNSMKYAFPDGRSGYLLIALHCRDDGLVTLRVADNGIGLPPGFDWRQSNSLGLRIVNILTAQLEARRDARSGYG